MNTEIHRDISTTPSTAIHQALDDLEVIRRTPGYEIDMSTWWTREDDVCSVCFGGCIMASILDYHPNVAREYHDLSPGSMMYKGLINDDQRRVIEAMDDIREPEPEDIERGLCKMGVPEDIAERIVAGYYVCYDEEPEQFIGQRRKLADDLRHEGY